MIGSALTVKGGMIMADRELLLSRLERLAIVLDDLMPGCADLVRETIELLKEQEAEIRQLRLALDIAKGTCKGIIAEGR